MERTPVLRGALILEGVIFLIMGILALIAPGIPTLSITLIVGIFLIIGGLFQGYRSLRNRHVSGFGVSFLSAILFLVIGIMFLARPLIGTLALTYLVLTFFILECASKFILAFELKAHHEHWYGVLISAIISALLVIYIFLNLPFIALWLIGILVGVYLLFFGVSMIVLGFGPRHRLEKV